MRLSLKIPSSSEHHGEKSPSAVSPTLPPSTFSSQNVSNIYTSQESLLMKKPNQQAHPAKSERSYQSLSTSSGSSCWDFLDSARIDPKILESLELNDTQSFRKTPSAEDLEFEENTVSLRREYEVDDVLKMSLRIQKSMIRPSDSYQNIPIVASLQFKAPSNFKKSSVDLICVIDKSSSMDGDKLKFVKSALSSLIEKLDENDRLSIVTFCHDAEVETDLLNMTDENKEKTLSTINLIKTDIGTSILEGLNLAFRIFKQRENPNPVSGIFLLSDGIDTVSINEIISQMESYKIKEEFSIHSFGFGKDHDPELMTRIADLKNGDFYYISELETVDQAFLGSLGALVSSFALDGKLTLTPVQHSFFADEVELKKMYWHSVTWYRDFSKGIYRTLVNQIQAEQTLNFVMELKVPSLSRCLQSFEKKVPIVRADFEFKTLSGDILTKSVELEINLLNKEEKSARISFLDDKVLMQYYRVKASGVMQMAILDANARDFEAARDLLYAFKKELKESSISSYSYIEDLLVDVNQAIEDCYEYVYSVDGKHRIISIARALGAEKYCEYTTWQYSTPSRVEYQNQAESAYGIRYL